MALRVLLADESSTIKKVIQLALQDFAVEVKSVHSGVDVLEVAKSFKPDLIFADVLLQKRNGYEASAELKSAFETKNIPIILMWSSFMELDEAAFQRAQANGRLEKPFDAETLRSLVTELVPKTRASVLSQHLDFSPQAFPREEAAAPRPAAPPQAPVAPVPEVKGPVVITNAPRPAPRQPEGPRSFELEDEASPFQFSELPKTPPQTPAPPAAPQPVVKQAAAPQPVVKQASAPAAERPSRKWEDITMPKVDDSENWSHQNLQQFNVTLEPLKIESDNVSIEFDIQHGELEGEKRLLANQTPEHSVQPTPPPQRQVSDDTVSRTGYLAPQTQTAARALSEEFDLSPPENDGLSVISSFETEDMQEMQIPRMSSSFDPPMPVPAPYEERRAPTQNQPIPQMSADELERIVRAQSREIIEALVRKIVPDLASEMIREELARLTDSN